MTSPMPSMEQSALVAADERWRAGIARVVSAETEEDFEREYAEYLHSLVSLADWKKIYGDRQRRWEEWMEINDADDRDTLKWCTPAPEWKAVMGW